jgi:hypothetical protein
MRRPTKLLSIIGSVILALSGAGVALSSPAQAATENICAAPGNTYCWSQPDTGNAIVLTHTTNQASFTPENCDDNGCQLVAVDGACVRAQYANGDPLLLWGCGGTSELSEYWYRSLCSGNAYMWVNAGATEAINDSNNYEVAFANGYAQGDQVYIGDASLVGCVDGPENLVDEWIWG